MPRKTLVRISYFPAVDIVQVFFFVDLVISYFIIWQLEVLVERTNSHK